ncbi:hypothetical protein H6S82_26140 [Planktothrix sp. FACHB-1355]|uniref:Uncharacterized protein n=1 Tax=Aerosakkonema funiforme FACHB-1375 TaxID=2949571 RepID=A0A926VJM4_9CYAN|nr:MULTISPECIES: hypothetical protein [Oscillatoriales]MBD2184980.1 hypothetical protein [Aerosakkonema funiforme FACHB-1375]MBD3562290.1 hypothetical protein [Planktothrix sp. FACHB-1355]
MAKINPFALPRSPVATAIAVVSSLSLQLTKRSELPAMRQFTFSCKAIAPGYRQVDRPGTAIVKLVI